MLNGTYALLERSLRIDARAWSTHLTRLGLLGAIYFSLSYSLLTSFMFGAPGLRFFQGIAYLDATFMTLLGIGFFATSITEEKEEDTLGLMLMAGISPLGILAGKSGGRLWQSLLLIAVQFPFVLLAVTMGGVMYTQVWSATFALLAYMVFLAGFGLLCSTLSPRGQTASAWMIVGLIIYFVAPSLAASAYADHMSAMLSMSRSQNDSIWWTLVDGVGHVCVFLELGSILTTGFRDTAFSIQVITNILAGMGCAGLSWLFFGVATRNLSSETNTRGLVARRPSSLFSTGVGAVRSSNFRPAASKFRNPFVWKDFHFVGGGDGMVLVRLAYYAGLGIVALMLEADKTVTSTEWFGMLIFLMWISVPINAARLVARSLQDEIRGQTLATLTMLPRSLNGIVYAKLGGALLGWLPALFVSIAITFFSPSMRSGIWDMSQNANGSWALLPMIVLYFALIPHFAGFLALYVRWGAVALAVGMTIGVYFVTAMGMTLIFMAFGAFPGIAVGSNSQVTLFGGIGLFFACLCAACHIGVLLRVQALAAR